MLVNVIGVYITQTEDCVCTEVVKTSVSITVLKLFLIKLNRNFGKTVSK